MRLCAMLLFVTMTSNIFAMEEREDTPEKKSKVEQRVNCWMLHEPDKIVLCVVFGGVILAVLAQDLYHLI